ncbi:MAG: 5-formyltetrahydrofolate cyclo-ligase [Pseudomonadota bacterium]
MPDISVAKQKLRLTQKAKRNSIKKDLQKKNATLLAQQIEKLLQAIQPLSAPPILAAYLPIASEINPLIACKKARSKGYQIAMPRVIEAQKPLQFFAWHENDPLEQEQFSTQAPLLNAKKLNPSIFLIPMLGFTMSGYRLGYGGGFYDRTLLALRNQNRNILAVGIAHHIQLCDDLPIDQYDQKLDAIISERIIHQCQQNEYLDLLA